MTETLTPDWRQRPTQVLAGLMLVALFALPCISGMLSPYLAMLTALISLVLVFSRDALMAALRDPVIGGFLLAFVLLAVAFGLSAQSPGDLLALGDFAVLLLAVPAFMLLRRAASRNGAFLLALAALAGAALACAFGYYQVLFLGVARADGNFSAIYYSDIGVMLGFLALAGLLAPGPKWRWIFALGPLFGMQAIMLGGTRGALIGAAILALTLLVIAPVKLSTHWKPVLSIAALAVAGLFLPVLILDFSRMTGMFGLLADAVTTGTTSDASVNYRLEFYAGGLRAFVDSPLFGHGWWRRFSAASVYMPPEVLDPGLSVRVGHLHNDAINFLSAAGLPGLAAYLSVLVAPVLSAFRSPRDSQRAFRLTAAAALSAGTLAFGLTDSVFVFELGKTFFCLGAIAIIAFCRDPAGLERT